MSAGTIADSQQKEKCEGDDGEETSQEGEKIGSKRAPSLSEEQVTQIMGALRRRGFIVIEL